jgi:hypothetical protein
MVDSSCPCQQSVMPEGLTNLVTDDFIIPGLGDEFIDGALVDGVGNGIQVALPRYQGPYSVRAEFPDLAAEFAAFIPASTCRRPQAPPGCVPEAPVPPPRRARYGRVSRQKKRFSSLTRHGSTSHSFQPINNTEDKKEYKSKLPPILPPKMKVTPFPCLVF